MDLIKPGRPPHSAPRVRRFALKVQQFTGPMMAKSLEDTAFYRYHRLLALNEVGGDPTADALPIDAFHAMMQRARGEWPHGMTATATHDTKRGEDARARMHGAGRTSGRMDQRGGALESAQRAASRHRAAKCARRRRPSNTCCIRPCSAPGRWTDRRYVHRTHAGLCAESRARRQAGNQLAQSRTRPMRRG